MPTMDRSGIRHSRGNLEEQRFSYMLHSSITGYKHCQLHNFVVQNCTLRVQRLTLDCVSTAYFVCRDNHSLHNFVVQRLTLDCKALHNFVVQRLTLDCKALHNFVVQRLTLDCVSNQVQKIINLDCNS